MRLHTPRALFVLLMGACLVAAFGRQATAHTPRLQDWAQWGGPRRDFKSDSTGLSGRWPARGPQRLWSGGVWHRRARVAPEPERREDRRKGTVAKRADARAQGECHSHRRRDLRFDWAYRACVLHGDRCEDRESVVAGQAI